MDSILSAINLLHPSRVMNITRKGPWLNLHLNKFLSIRFVLNLPSQPVSFSIFLAFLAAVNLYQYSLKVPSGQISSTRESGNTAKALFCSSTAIRFLFSSLIKVLRYKIPKNSYNLLILRRMACTIYMYGNLSCYLMAPFYL